MIISHKLKLIFINVQRTASTTLSNIIRQNLGNDFDTLSQHSNAKTEEVDFFKKHNDYYTFGFTRNPWERVFSWYSLIHSNDKKSIVEERIRFETFIEKDLASDFTENYFHYNTLDYFTNKNGKVIADEIFRYENLDNDIKKIAAQFNFKLTEIPVLNNSNLKKHKIYYTKKSIDLIARKCKKDIEFFKYTF